jgi:CRISPR/Cas system-associated exonuclease Cas4 (RecB family)
MVRHLSGVEKDYSSNLVVFPGKRPAHFLRKALAEKERSSFIPPSIFSMDEFIDFIYGEILGHRERKIESIDAVAILYDIHKHSPNPVGSKSFLTPDTFFPIGLKIYSDLEELYIEGVAPATVKEMDHIVGEKIPEPSARRLQSLSYFYEAFYKKIDKAHCSTRSSRYCVVSSKIDQVNLGPFKKMIFGGFFGLTRSEREIFNSLKRKEESLFLFQDGFGMNLSELGMMAEKEVVPGEPEIHFYKSPDTHGQVFGLGSLLKDRIDSGESLDEKTVIVLPVSETLFPLLHQSLSLLNPDDYNVSLGYPLQRTPLFGLFNNLMELIISADGDRLYVPYYLRFILHPYIKNIYFEGRADLTRILFHTIEEALTEKRARKFMSLSEIERDEMITDFIKERILGVESGITLKMMKDHLKTIHGHTMEKMLSFKNVGGFAKKLKEVIEYIYEKSTARLHPFFYPYSESFVIQLDLISRSQMQGIQFEEKASYFNLVKRVIMTAYTPFLGTPLRGVQVLGFLETRNIKFEKVFFLDVNEGVVPKMTKEDTLLPFKVRKLLGLPTYLDREKLMAYIFDTLIRGAQEVHLFYVENDEKERSRWVEKLLWDRQKREGRGDDKSYVKAIQYSVTLQGQRPRPILKSDQMIQFLKNYSFSASSLDVYLRCPLQFYYEYVLGLREREIVSDELEREEIGLFVHQVLFDYFKAKLGQTLSEGDMGLKPLEEIIHERFEEHYGKDPTGELFLLKRQISNHLKDFIRNYQIPKIKEYPLKILNLEKRLEVAEDSFRLNARLDRIEKRGERTVIVDYKTSARKKYLSINYHKFDLENRDSWREAIGTLQLPFYLNVYSKATGERPEGIDCIFLILGRTRIDRDIELPLFEGEPQFHQRFGELHYVIFSLLREIVNPEKPFMPTPAMKNGCDPCIYRNICTN